MFYVKSLAVKNFVLSSIAGVVSVALRLTLAILCSCFGLYLRDTIGAVQCDLGFIGLIDNSDSFLTSLFILNCRSQCTHRVATATFWRKFHHDGKISPAWRGWGCPHPLSLYLSSLTKLWCMLQLRGQIHSPYFYSSFIHICTLWYELNHRLEST